MPLPAGTGSLLRPGKEDDGTEGEAPVDDEKLGKAFPLDMYTQFVERSFAVEKGGAKASHRSRSELRNRAANITKEKAAFETARHYKSMATAEVKVLRSLVHGGHKPLAEQCDLVDFPMIQQLAMSGELGAQRPSVGFGLGNFGDTNDVVRDYLAAMRPNASSAAESNADWCEEGDDSDTSGENNTGDESDTGDDSDDADDDQESDEESESELMSVKLLSVNLLMMTQQPKLPKTLTSRFRSWLRLKLECARTMQKWPRCTRLATNSKHLCLNTGPSSRARQAHMRSTS
jgi:hypothetical protein